MPGQVCAVASCSSNRLMLKREGICLTFHSFPKVDDDVRKEWISRCNRGDTLNPKTSTICSLHFIPSDYERDLQSELLGLPLRKVLKKTAVPTLYLDCSSAATLFKRTRKKYAKRAAKKKNDKQLADFLLENMTNPDEPSHIVTVWAEPTDTPTPDTYKQNCKQLSQNSNKKKNEKVKRNKVK